MRRRIALLVLLALAAFGGGTVATAHQCTDPADPATCNDDPEPNWRGSYLPLFEPVGRDDPAVRRWMQKWRDCPEMQQSCTWLYGGTSLVPGQGGELSPNELHFGNAASHCFLFEAAHQCENHTHPGEGYHDAHGGALFGDLCLTPNPQGGVCADGDGDGDVLENSVLVVVIMDHNPCGPVVPVVACTDEYHVLKPFDPDYTAQQMAMTQATVMRALADPAAFLREYLCGYPPPGGGFCLLP